MQRHCKVYAFFKATRGNWRNAIYVSCEKETCPYGHNPACTGYLFTTNEYGHPMVISETDYIRLSGEAIDATECRDTITRDAFESMYAQYVYWQIDSSRDCPIRIMGKQIAGYCQCTNNYF